MSLLKVTGAAAVTVPVITLVMCGVDGLTDSSVLTELVAPRPEAVIVTAATPGMSPAVALKMRRASSPSRSSTTRVFSPSMLMGPVALISTARLQSEPIALRIDTGISKTSPLDAKRGSVGDRTILSCTITVSLAFPNARPDAATAMSLNVPENSGTSSVTVARPCSSVCTRPDHSETGLTRLAVIGLRWRSPA